MEVPFSLRAAKLQLFFDICKKKVNFFLFFVFFLFFRCGGIFETVLQWY